MSGLVLAPAAPTTAGRHHPVAAFALLVAAVAWPVMALPILAARGAVPGGRLLERLPLDVEQVAALLGTAALLPAALLVTARVDGRRRLVVLRSRALRSGVGLWGWLLAVASLPAGTVLVGAVLGGGIVTDGLPRVLLEEAGALLVAVAVVNLAEEVIWAGLLQSRLEVGHRVMTAAALTAVPFALVHVPLTFVDTDAAVLDAALQFVALVVIGTVVRFLLALVLRATRDSVLAVAAFHASFNTSNGTDGVADRLLDGPHAAAGLIATAALTIALAVALRRGLGRRDQAAEGLT